MTLGFVRLMQLKELNIITAFIGGILLGMGIDFGVHLTARYMQERGDKKSLKEALNITMIQTGRALITAATTTAGALYLLFFSSFRGFWEFGLIAGTGIIITLITFLVFFPLAVVLLEKLMKMKGKGLIPFDISTSNNRTKFPKVSFALLTGGLFITVLIAFVGLPKLKFETNFRRLSGKPSTKIKYGKAMGDNVSFTVALCKIVQDCALYDNYLKKLLNRPLANLDIRDYLVVTSFIPEDQDKKLIHIRSMSQRISKARVWADDNVKKRLNEMVDLIPKKAMTINDLPEWIKSRFREKDGKIGRFLYL